MIAYWTLFLVPLAWGVASQKTDQPTQRLILGAFGLLIIVLVGLRDHTGCDWRKYLMYYHAMRDLSVAEALETSDVGYALLNWVAFQLDLDIYFVNFVCAAIFAIGLVAFAVRQPSPWTVLSLAACFLVVVVAMGFTRQATAIGMLMLAMNAFEDRRRLRFLLYVGFASLFHLTAIIFGPLAFLINRRNSLLPLIVAGGALAIAGSFVLIGTADYLVQTYVDAEMGAEGGVVRSLVSGAAAGIFLIFRQGYFRAFRNDADLYQVLSVAALLCLPLVFTAPAAVDRLGLYLLPFQIAVFARLPTILHDPALRVPIHGGIVISYGLMLYIWLNYSPHASSCWVPYESILAD